MVENSHVAVTARHKFGHLGLTLSCPEINKTLIYYGYRACVSELAYAHAARALMVISARQLVPKPSHPLQLASLERQIRACQDGRYEVHRTQRPEEEGLVPPGEPRPLSINPLDDMSPISILFLPSRRFRPATSSPSSAVVPIHSYARKRCFSLQLPNNHKVRIHATPPGEGGG
ncbi:hypothetical protein LX36DRAFT_336612 [Colletotrichum falcatum]|nr:hypothetical protein LX36DRAFT_336612 [Colletotrichum falcatum]